MISFILLFSLILLIVSGVAIPVAMGITIIIVFLIGDYPLYLLAQGLISRAGNWALLSVLFFLTAGGFMNELGVTQRLFDFATACVGHIRGGLAHVNVLASMIFAGISGSSAADVGGLGKIEYKAMREAGYDKKIIAGITVASSVIGPIIPPSIVFILYAIIADVSIGKLFVAGVFPGILIGVSLMVTTYFRAIKNPKQFPETKKTNISEFISTFKGAILVIFAPILIILGMTSGYVSPTEAGAGAAVYSLFIGLLFKTIKIKPLWGALKTAMLQGAHAILLVSLASVMGFILTYERTPQLIAESLGIIAKSQWSMLFIINILSLLIGCFMSGTAALIILTPIFLPIVKNIGIDPIHFGVILAYGLHIGTATPPVGVGLYLMSDIAGLSFEDTVLGVAPYLVPLIISLFIITYFPQISLWLPNMLFR